jgi:hypothetical protein
MEGDRPNAAAHEVRLKAIPANTWVAMNPPKRYQMNRDWGTSVIDTDHDLFLQWSGGHSAYGGTDVAQYHFATNRWELPFPTELPLGLTYSNSSYPGGYNFNLRPWMTGHTYKGYAYSPELKRLVLVVRCHQWEYAHDPYFYLYDPFSGDWTSRHPKPAAMCFPKHMYTVQVCHTAHGLFAWARSAALLFDHETKTWRPLKTKGTLPGVVVDSSGLVYDSKRDRILFVRKGYGKRHRFDGQIHALGLNNLTVSALTPEGGKAMPAIFLREGIYHSDADLFLWGAGQGQMAAYDPAGNRWLTILIAGTAPFGHSTGHVYDPKRKLCWVVEQRAGVWCMRLDPNTAEMTPLP